MTDNTIQNLLTQAENNIHSIDFWPDFEPATRSESDALCAVWVCPITDKEVKAVVQWETDSNSVSDWLDRNRDRKTGDWSDSDWQEARAEMAAEAETTLHAELRLNVANHLRSLLGLPPRTTAWTDAERRDADAAIQPELPL